MESKTKKYVENAGDINIGQMLKDYFKKRRTGKSALARRIGRTDNAILNYQKRPSLQSGIIIELSHALKHNFLADMAYLLPAEYTNDVPIDTSKDIRIAELEKEVEILKAEKAVLLLALGNR